LRPAVPRRITGRREPSAWPCGDPAAAELVWSQRAASVTAPSTGQLDTAAAIFNALCSINASDQLASNWVIHCVSERIADILVVAV